MLKVDTWSHGMWIVGVWELLWTHSNGKIRMHSNWQKIQNRQLFLIQSYLNIHCYRGHIAETMYLEDSKKAWMLMQQKCSEQWSKEGMSTVEELWEDYNPLVLQGTVCSGRLRQTCLSKGGTDCSTLCCLFLEHLIIGSIKATARQVQHGDKHAWDLAFSTTKKSQRCSLGAQQTPKHSSESQQRLYHSALSPWAKSNSNLQLQDIMLQFALEVKEVGDGQLPLQICPKEVCCQCRVEAGLQGVPSCGPVSVAHAHAGLGANDALNLKNKREEVRIKITMGNCKSWLASMRSS